MAWSQADVDAVNARRPKRFQMPENPTTAKIQAVAARIAKGHKYRAIPCIVTADLTLYTADDIRQLELVSDHPMIGTGSLKERANRVDVFGEWFGSTKEAKRWIELKHLETAGHVRGLSRQIAFPLMVGDIAIGSWVADFVYQQLADPVTWVDCREDCKGMRTALYKRSKAHVEAQYGFQIRET